MYNTKNIDYDPACPSNSEFCFWSGRRPQLDSSNTKVNHMNCLLGTFVSPICPEDPHCQYLCSHNNDKNMDGGYIVPPGIPCCAILYAGASIIIYIGCSIFIHQLGHEWFCYMWTYHGNLVIASILSFSIFIMLSNQIMPYFWNNSCFIHFCTTA